MKISVWLGAKVVLGLGAISAVAALVERANEKMTVLVKETVRIGPTYGPERVRAIQRVADGPTILLLDVDRHYIGVGHMTDGEPGARVIQIGDEICWNWWRLARDGVTYGYIREVGLCD